MKIEKLPKPGSQFNLGMYHDGTNYRVVQWGPNPNPWTHNNLIQSRAIDDGNNCQIFHLLSVVDEKVDVKMFVLNKITSPAIWSALLTICSRGQFHCLPTASGGLEICGYAKDDLWNFDNGAEIGLEIGADRSVKWAELRDYDEELTAHCFSMGNEWPHRSSSFSPYTLTVDNVQYAIMRNGTPFQLSGISVPQQFISSNRYAICNKNILYFNNRNIFVHTIKELVVKLVPKKIIVDVKPSPDGRVLMVVTKSQIFFYNTVDWTLIRILEVQKTKNKKLRYGLEYGAWSPDGLTFAVMARNFIQIWDNDELW